MYVYIYIIVISINMELNMELNIELYFHDNDGYIYKCLILNPEIIINNITDNVNQYFYEYNIKFKILEIFTITNNNLRFKPKFKINDIMQNYKCFHLYKIKQNVIYDLLTKKNFYIMIKNEYRQLPDYYIDKKILKLFKENISGEIKKYYKNGNIQYSFYHINGNLEGMYKSYYDNGNIYYEIQFINNKKHGFQRIYKENNSLRAEYYFIDGVLNGITKLINNDNIVEIINYKDGKKNGLYEKIKDNKIIKSCEYENNLKNGIEKIYNFYDDLYFLEYSIEYKNGKKDGEHKKYNIDNNVIVLNFYKNNKLITEL